MNVTKTLTLVATLSLLLCGVVSCGGSSGGDDSNTTAANDTTLTLEGTLRFASARARMLTTGQGGVAGITVSALGDSATTDEFGNFNLFVDGIAHTGGAVEFTFAGTGVSAVSVMNEVPGGAGATSFVDFYLEENGEVSGEAFDTAGNVVGTTPGAGLGCTQTGTFSDGALGALWKPVSESTGTAVILMPPEYRNAEVVVFNSLGDEVATPIRRNCCEDNGGREHVWLSQSSGALAGQNPPLTVRFSFSDGFVDCREVADPRQRYD